MTDELSEDGAAVPERDIIEELAKFAYDHGDGYTRGGYLPQLLGYERYEAMTEKWLAAEQAKCDAETAEQEAAQQHLAALSAQVERHRALVEAVDQAIAHIAICCHETDRGSAIAARDVLRAARAALYGEAGA